MRSGTRAADGDTFAAEIFGFFDIGPRVESKVELLMKTCDADEICAAETGVNEVPGADDRRIDLTGNQRRNRQRVPRHQDELHVQAVLFEQAALASHPHRGHGLAGDAGGEIRFDLAPRVPRRAEGSQETYQN